MDQGRGGGGFRLALICVPKQIYRPYQDPLTICMAHLFLSLFALPRCVDPRNGIERNAVFTFACMLVLVVHISNVFDHRTPYFSDTTLV